MDGDEPPPTCGEVLLTPTWVDRGDSSRTSTFGDKRVISRQEVTVSVRMNKRTEWTLACYDFAHVLFAALAPAAHAS